MDGHASIYLSDDEAGGQSTGRRLAGWDGVPLTFKVLASQNPRLVESSEPGHIAIRGDFQAGRARLFAFLDALATQQMFDPKRLADQVAALVSLLYGVTPPPRYVILDVATTPPDAAPAAASAVVPVTEPAAEPGAVPGSPITDASAPDAWQTARRADPAGMPDFIDPYNPASPAQPLLDEVSDVDGLIARAMTQLDDLKAAGQTDEMWHMLGIKARQSAVATPAPARPASSYPATNRSTLSQWPRYVSRPTSLTVVCVINFVALSLAILSGLVLLFTALAKNVGVAALLSLFVVAYSIAMIVLVVRMMNGSRTARKVYVGLVIANIPLVIYNITQGGLAREIVSTIITIIYLAVLFSTEVNDYIDYVSGPPTKPRN